MNRSVLLTAALLVLSAASLADDKDAGKQALLEEFSKASQFAVPDSPASALLGDTDMALSRPQNVRQLAMELATFHNQGKDAKGFSLVLSPATMFAGKYITLEKYRTKPVIRQLTRLELSSGLANASSEPNSVRRAAVGLSLTPFDAGDPRLDEALSKCIGAQYQQVLLKADPPTELGKNPSFVKAVAEVAPKLKECSDESAARQRSSSSLKLGVAKGWASAVKQPGWHDGGWGAWVAGMYSPAAGMDAAVNPSPMRLLFRLKHVSQSQWDDATSTWSKERTRDATAQFRYAFDSKGLDALVEVGVTKEASAARNVRRISLGVEKKLAENLWFILTATAKSGVDKDHPGTLVLGKLKFDFGSDPVLLNQ